MLTNLNLSRYRDPQVEAGEDYLHLFNSRDQTFANLDV